jgi:hypothetical protein
MRFLAAEKAAARKHPKEDALTGDELRAIGYLRLYTFGHSIRLYFTVIDGVLWMLHLDISKRQKNLSEGTEARLLQRLKDVRAEAAKRKQNERSQS